MESSKKHISVMLEECLQHFADRQIKTFFEGTMGAGGHAFGILKAHPEIQRYIGCDHDPEALQIAKDRLQEWSSKMIWIQGDFGDLDRHLEERGIATVDGFFLTSECHLCN